MKPFFPRTCHPPLSRRRFLAATAGVLGGAALGRDRAHAAADPNATAIIADHATRPEDPWSVAHGMRAMGSGFTIRGGQRAVDFLLEKHVTEVMVRGQAALAFPRAVEVHPNSFLKTMLEAGVPLNHPFTHGGKPRTLEDLVEGARLLLKPGEMTDPNKLPWSLIAFSRVTPQIRRRWTNAWGEAVDLDALVDQGLRDLENASAPIAAAMRAGQPLADKAPVHGFTCGGTHMLYGLLSAVHYGFGGKTARVRVQFQTALMVWRMGGADVDLISRFYAANPRTPINQWEELDSKLKVLGHAEECLAFATKRGVVSLSAAQQDQRAAGVTRVRALLADVKQNNLAAVRTLEPKTFQQLIGDTCHAQHGLAFS